MSNNVKFAVAAAALFAALPSSVEAMPVAPGASVDAGTILVSGGCGPYAHRGPLLGCRPNRPLVAPLVRRGPVCRTVLLPIPHRVCR